MSIRIHAPSVVLKPFTEPDTYARGEGWVNCYMSTCVIGMHLRHRATHIHDVTFGLITVLVL